MRDSVLIGTDTNVVVPTADRPRARETVAIVVLCFIGHTGGEYHHATDYDGTFRVVFRDGNFGKPACHVARHRDFGVGLDNDLTRHVADDVDISSVAFDIGIFVTVGVIRYRVVGVDRDIVDSGDGVVSRQWTFDIRRISFVPLSRCLYNKRRVNRVVLCYHINRGGCFYAAF